MVGSASWGAWRRRSWPPRGPRGRVAWRAERGSPGRRRVAPSAGARSACRGRPRGTAAASGRARGCLARGRCRSRHRSAAAAGPGVVRTARVVSSGGAGTASGMGSPHHLHSGNDRVDDLRTDVQQNSCQAQRNRGKRQGRPCPSREAPGGSRRTGPLHRPHRPSPQTLTVSLVPRRVDVAHYAPRAH